MAPGGPVLAGVDGSEQSLVAARWAVAEGELRQAEVRIVMVNNDPPRDDELWSMLEGAVEQFATEYPHLELYPKIARGHPAGELVRRSAEAQLVVVGSRGRSAFAQALLGSVSAKVATHAHCPVVVVRDHGCSGPVIVGLDNSPHSRDALQFAFEAAAARGTELVALQVWQYTEYAPVVAPLDSEWVPLKEDAERGLAEQLAGWRETYPNVDVRRVAQRGHPVAELTHASREAQLLVVGHRGLGGFTGLLLGSVAAGVLHHAPCPVAVVRDESSGRE